MAADENSKLVTDVEIRDARDYIVTQDLYVRTPLLRNVQRMFCQVAEQEVDLYLKLEHMQNTGSFKIRGVLNQMRHMDTVARLDEKRIPITMSAGNYGKAFGTYLHSKGIRGCCIIPETAPKSRVGLIKSLGVDVELKPTLELQATIDNYVTSGSHVFFPPFDDRHLISGYGSVGLEILEEVSDPDVVLVCCGGGGLVSGVAAAIKTSKTAFRCRVYAVEPLGAPCMSESFKAGRAVSRPVQTVATGLAPPFAGKLTYQHCAEFLEGVLLVSDEEIVECVKLLYKRGLVVEPSGAAAMAALVYGRVPDVAGKKVVVVITGGNFTPEEMHTLLSNTTKSDR